MAIGMKGKLTEISYKKTGDLKVQGSSSIAM